MKPLVIYHANCADGFGAAFAAWLKFGDEAEYVPFKYNEGINQDKVLGREVYILDFSFPKDLMECIFEDAKKVIWLDHHKTAFEMWCGGIPDSGIHSNFGDPFYDYQTSHTIVLDNNKSGAMIAWEYFHPGTEVPLLIKHIDDYDRWQFKIEKTKEFNKALWSYAPWSFEQWENFFPLGAPTIVNWRMEDMYKEGAAILRAHDQNVQAVVKGAARKCAMSAPKDFNPLFDGYWPEGNEFGDLYTLPGLAANCPPHLSSDVGHQLANASGTYGLLWSINKEGKCVCSLRSNGDYDVSAIAKVFGGGGHKNAAGFEVDIQTLLGWVK